MIRLGFIGFLYSLSIISCSVEKVNLSPTSRNFSYINNQSPKQLLKNFEESKDFIEYGSEITNSFSILENISDKKIRKEIDNLKLHISELIYAVRGHNSISREKAFYNYEISYKKLQKLKKELSKDEQDIFNRFLVKIKTNINLINSL